MNLDDLDFSRERAILRLSADLDKRKALSRIVTSPQKWKDLLTLDWGVSEACIFDLVDYLYGLRFARYGSIVVKKGK